MVPAVLGLEEHDGSPVVGKILNEGAGRASGLGGEIVLGGVHGNVERVTTDNLVKMGGVEHAGVDNGVDTVDDELRARESKHVLASDVLRKERGRGGEGEGLHCWQAGVLFFLGGCLVSSNEGKRKVGV